MERVIVERRLAEPMTEERLLAAAGASKACMARYRIKHVRTLVSADGLRVLCEYEAPDAESVRRAQTQSGLPFEEVWTAQVFEAPTANPTAEVQPAPAGGPSV